MGESANPRATLRFDRRVRLEFHGATITSDAGLLACRELDDALGLTETADECLQESRGGRNVQHRLVGLVRQSVYSRLAGYEDTNDAERLAQDPTMRVIVGRRGGPERPAASTNTMSRFETEVLTQDGNVEGLGRLNAKWVDGAMSRTPHRRVILDMDSSESPVHGEQEGASYNGHFGSTCYHPLFVFNQFGDCEGAKLREGTTTILPRGGERSRESDCLQCAFTPLAGARRRQRRTRTIVHGKKRIPCWIDRRLTGLAAPDYDATISWGCPLSLKTPNMGNTG